MKSLKLRSWALVWRYILKWPKAPKYKFKKPYKIGYSISVQSFCFNYFLFIDSILIIINTFLSKLHLSTRNKKKSSFSLKRPPIISGFNTQPRIKSLQRFCIANDKKSSTQMIMLTNCARSLETSEKIKDVRISHNISL